MIFKEYLDKIIGKHEHIDRLWIERSVSEALGEDRYQQLMEADTNQKALGFGIIVGVRPTINHDGDIITIYKDKDPVAKRTFQRPIQEEDE